MSLILNQEVTDLLNDEKTIRIIATADGEGVPHMESRPSLHVGADGKIHFLEFHEYSTTSSNLIRSIWFDRPLAIILKGTDGCNVQIKGKAVKNLIAGPLFQQHYLKVRAQNGDVDLAGVWIIEPEQVIDQGFDQHPYSRVVTDPVFTHLDRIAFHDGQGTCE